MKTLFLGLILIFGVSAQAETLVCGTDNLRLEGTVEDRLTLSDVAVFGVYNDNEALLATQSQVLLEEAQDQNTLTGTLTSRYGAEYILSVPASWTYGIQPFNGKLTLKTKVAEKVAPASCSIIQ